MVIDSDMEGATVTVYILYTTVTYILAIIVLLLLVPYYYIYI